MTKILILILKVAIGEETTEYYILHCHIYDHERAKLAVQLKTIDESLDLLYLLTIARDSNKEKHQKKLTFLISVVYDKDPDPDPNGRN
jgi:hypothetical protein